MTRNNFFKICIIAASLITSTAYARWVTNTDDDLFSGGKQAMMLGEVSSQNSAIIFDCTKQSLKVSYVEMDKTSEVTSDIPMDLILKVDANSPVKLDATLSRRNVQSIQISSNDDEQIKTLLKQIKDAKSKILIGFQTKDGGNQISLSGNASGSTVAVNSFVNACEITL